MIEPIQSERLLIRPRTPADLEACIAMDRDPAVTQYITGPWQDRDAHIAFLTERLTATYPYPLGYWTITFRDAPDEFLGWVMLLPSGPANSEAEIGWRLNRKSWGKGIGTEAALACVGLLRKTSPNIKITAAIHPENTGSIKLAKKIGMSFSHETLIDGVSEQVYAF